MKQFDLSLACLAKPYIFLGLTLLLTAGCSTSNIGQVTGTVTADGKPLPNAMVSFFPRPEGRASQAMTNEEGKYELVYSRGQMGALIGPHMVQITTAVDGGDYGDTIAKEIIPIKYNVDSELTAEVKSGNNVIDFDLDLTGEVVQSAY